VPVFICTQEGEHEIRGSARGIPEFDVYGALKYCDDLLPKYGGHPAAGGFSCPLTHLDALRDRLRDYAHQHLELHHLKPLVTIDAQADFSQLTAELYEQIEALQPWGMANPTPVFWSSQVQVVNQKTVKGNHLKVTFAQNCDGKRYQMGAIAWHWGEYQLPSPIDIAYQLTENNWQGQQRIELQLVGVRCDPERLTESAPTAVDTTLQKTTRKSSKKSKSTPKKVTPDSTPAISTQSTDSTSAVDSVAVETTSPFPQTSADAILPRQANANKPEVSVESNEHNSHADAEELAAAQGTASDLNVESNEQNSHADAEELATTAGIVPDDDDESLEMSPSLTTAPAKFTPELSPPEGQTPAISTTQSPLENPPEPATTASQTEFKTTPKTPESPRSRKVQFQYRDRVYECSLANAQNELRIRNSQGKVLAVQKGQRLGLLGERRETAVQVDVTQPHYYSLIKTALAALEAVKS
jgi:single-stranded-DNA-specific exonuclease